MISRYSHPEMAALWSEQNRFANFKSAAPPDEADAESGIK